MSVSKTGKRMGRPPVRSCRGEMIPWRVDPDLRSWLADQPDPRTALEAVIRQAMAGPPPATARSIPAIPDRLSRAIESAATRHGMTLERVIEQMLSAVERESE